MHKWDASLCEHSDIIFRLAWVRIIHITRSKIGTVLIRFKWLFDHWWNDLYVNGNHIDTQPNSLFIVMKLKLTWICKQHSFIKNLASKRASTIKMKSYNKRNYNLIYRQIFLTVLCCSSEQLGLIRFLNINCSFVQWNSNAAKYRFPLKINRCITFMPIRNQGRGNNGNNVAFYQFKPKKINKLVSKETIKTVCKANTQAISCV